MVRPRWHDALIIGGIVALLAIGVWALWWEDVRAFFKIGPDTEEKAPVRPGQT